MPARTDSSTILAIDDEPAMLRLLRLELSTQGYTVVAAQGGEEGLALFREHRPLLVLVDLMMPGTDGIEVLRQIKASGETPVIVMSADSSESVRVNALKLGADDFVTKPFSPERLTETIELLLAERRGERAPSLVVSGGLVVDLRRQTVTRGGDPISLGRSEWQLIEELAKRPGEPRLYQELLAGVWGAQYRDDVDYLRVWVDRLRAKLGDADPPSVIVPYLDVGYTLNARYEPAL